MAGAVGLGPGGVVGGSGQGRGGVVGGSGQGRGGCAVAVAAWPRPGR